MKFTHPRQARRLALIALAAAFLSFGGQAQTPVQAATPPDTHYIPSPSLDIGSLDVKADPCSDFYKFACGNYAANHPILPDQSSVSQFENLYELSAQQIDAILQAGLANPNRTPAQQKIGDDYAACANTALIEQKGLTPIQPLLDEISKVSKFGLPYLAGELQRQGVTAFFSFSQQQDEKDSARQVAYLSQGGLGLFERGYYTRTGDKDKLIRDQYVDYITQLLTASGEPAPQAATEAKNILIFETKLAEASLTNVEMRDPVATYHPQTLADFEADIRPVPFAPFLEAIHAPALAGPLGPNSLVNSTPRFFPAMVSAVMATDIQTLRAYLRFHTLDTFAANLPKRFNDLNFAFYGHTINGQEKNYPRWKVCSIQVDASLGELLGRLYVEQFFPASNKASTLQMIEDIEAAMDRDIDTLDWMTPTTKTRAKEKLHALSNKIGYPDRWRDYTSLGMSSSDAFGNQARATAFENDRQLAKIGQPVDKLEWSMTPPTINAYYDPSNNNINFPAGILQSPYYNATADLALNYGHIGAIMGHELTHGFDDEGKKFDGQGNLSDWWTPTDTKNFEAKTGCLANEYDGFVAVGEGNDAVHVNGKLTLGENTADNGGLVLAYLAYLQRAKQQGLDTTAKIGGYTGPQRFYISFAQNWCENARPEQVRNQVLTDSHSPPHFRANGAIVNQPGFAAAFGCKVGTPMVPTNSCRVW